MASEGTLKCKYCDTSFSDSTGLYRHNKLHQCKICKKIFPKADPDEHYRHNLKHICKICKKVFPEISDVIQHEREHTNFQKSMNIPSYKCIYCNIQLKTMNELTEHHSKHECMLCRKTFNNISDCEVHIKDYHATSIGTSLSIPNANFMCKICNIQFSSPFELMDHVCSVPINNKSNQQSLIQSHKSKENNTNSHNSLLTKKKRISIQCDTCLSDFDSIESLTNHKRSCKKDIDSKFGLLSDIPSDLLACIPSFQSPENSPKKVYSKPVSLLSPFAGLSSMPNLEPINAKTEPIEIETEANKTDSTIKCNVCYREFNSESKDYLNHDCIRPGGMIDNAPLVCLVCGNIYHKLSGFRSHPCAIRNGISELIHNCEFCTESFLWITDYQKHVLQKHSKNKCIICCDFSGADDASFTFHMDTQHKAVCKKCSERFYTNKELNIHFTLQHSDERSTYKFVCCSCFTICHSASNLFEHYKTHDQTTDIKKRPGSGLFACPKTGCPAAFRGINSLKEHINSKHKDDVESTRQTVLNANKIKESVKSTGIVTDSAGGKIYPWSKPSDCKVCKQTFPSLTVLKAHQKTHIKSASDKGPFPCITCGKNISSYRNLKKHRIGCLKKDREKKLKDAFFESKESKKSKGDVTPSSTDSSDQPNVEVLIQGADLDGIGEIGNFSDGESK